MFCGPRHEASPARRMGTQELSSLESQVYTLLPAHAGYVIRTHYHVRAATICLDTSHYFF